MMIPDSELRQAIRAFLPEIVEIRHRIHAHPELSGQECETGRLVRKVLEGTRLVLHEPYLETDVVGLLRGTAGDGDNVTLRADMDALPRFDFNDDAIPYGVEILAKAALAALEPSFQPLP